MRNSFENMAIVGAVVAAMANPVMAADRGNAKDKGGPQGEVSDNNGGHTSAGSSCCGQKSDSGADEESEKRVAPSCGVKTIMGTDGNGYLKVYADGIYPEQSTLIAIFTPAANRHSGKGASAAIPVDPRENKGGLFGLPATKQEATVKDLINALGNPELTFLTCGMVQAGKFRDQYFPGHELSVQQRGSKDQHRLQQ